MFRFTVTPRKKFIIIVVVLLIGLFILGKSQSNLPFQDCRCPIVECPPNDQKPAQDSDSETLLDYRVENEPKTPPIDPLAPFSPTLEEETPQPEPEPQPSEPKKIIESPDDIPKNLQMALIEYDTQKSAIAGFKKPVDLMIVVKHLATSRTDFGIAFNLSKEEVYSFNNFLYPSVKSCEICQLWMFSLFNPIEMGLFYPENDPKIFTMDQAWLIQTHHYQKHILGYSRITLFTSADDTVSFDFWKNLDTFLQSPDIDIKNKNYCIYPKKQIWVFPFESNTTTYCKDSGKPEGAYSYHLFIGIMGTQYFSPMFLDHVAFLDKTRYPCEHVAIDGEAYYIRRRSSHSSIVHPIGYTTHFNGSSPCSYNQETGYFDLILPPTSPEPVSTLVSPQ